MTKTVVLVVDDDPETCWSLAHILQKLGLCAVKALNGRAALQLAEAHHPSIALVDAKLPDIGGLDLAGQMRMLSPSICTIMISGYHYRDDPMIEAALCSGIIFDFIGKPFLHSEVVRVVETVLKTQQRGLSPD